MGRFSTSGSSEIAYNFKINTAAARKEITDFGNFLKRFKIDPAGITGFTVAQGRMTKAMRDSLLESERLRQENTRLRNEYEQGRISAQQLAAQTRALNEQRRAEAAALREARRNQVAATGSYNEARQRLAAMRREIYEATNGFTQMGRVQNARIEDYRRLNNQLAEFDRRMGNQRGGYGQNALQGLQSMAATYLTGSAILSGGRKVLDMNIELSDSLSDVQRTAGLTASEANNLAEQLKKIDTRTSLKGLVDIAVIGGQLGIAKEQLAGFTTAVNQLAVSLSGELQGGAEGIAKSLGVLDNVFKVTQSNGGNVEKSLNQIGSAILGLGQSGQATGDFLADFGERVGGLGKQFGLSLPVILSYGAVLQENGVSAEVAGSSFKRLVSSLISNRGKFLAVAQISDSTQTLSSFTNLINTDLKKALDLFFDGLSKGGTKNSSFNDTLKALKLTGGGVSQAIAAIADNQAKLNEHVQDATKDFNDASLAAEQYAIKNDNLAGSWDKLGNTISNAFTAGPVAGFFKVLIDGLNDATKKFIGLTQSRSWMEFFTRITPFANTKGFDINNQIADNFKAGTATSYDLNSIYDKQQRGDQVGILELQKAYGDALAATKSALKDYQNFEKGLKSKELRDTNGQLGVLANRFKYLRDQTKYFTDEYNKAKAKLPKDAIPTGGDITIPGSDKAAQAEARRLETALTGQRALQFKIDELTQKGLDKQLDANDQEVAAVKMKYAKMIEEAMKFNASSKNQKYGLKVNTSGLVRAEKEEVAAVVYSQDTTRLKNTLDEQKRLYADFEDYKLRFGSAKAKERYDKLINTDKTYLEQLKAAYAISIGQGYLSGFTGETSKRMAYLNNSIKTETQAEQKKHDDLLFGLQTYAEKRKNLEEQMAKEVNRYTSEGNMEKAEQQRKLFQQQLLSLGESHVQQLDSYKRFFEDLDGLSNEAMGKRLETLKSDIAKLDSPELKEFLEKLLRAGQIQLNTKTLDGYKNLVSSLQEAASASEGLSAGIAEGLGMAVKLGTAAVNIKGSFDAFKLAQKDNNPLGMLNAGIAGVSAALSVAGIVKGIFDKARQFREENRKVIDDFNSKRFIGEFDINQLYRERVRLQLELNKATLSGLKGNTNTLKSQVKENAADYNRIAGLLAGESFITGYKNTVDKMQVVQVAVLESLAGKSYAEIEKLFMSSQLTDRAKQLFEQLKKLKDEGLDIDKLLSENTKSIMEAATGTTAETIRDSIITGFENGYRTAADFANDFKSLMNSATKQIFKEFVDNQELAAFYKKYAEMAEQGALSDTQKSELKTLYDEMITRINGKYNELKGITGDDFLVDPKNNNTNSMAGSVATQLTEATGTIIAGGINGIQLNTRKAAELLVNINTNNIQMAKTAIDSFQSHIRMEAHMLRVANNTDILGPIDTSLKSIDRKMLNNYNALMANGRP